MIAPLTPMNHLSFPLCFLGFSKPVEPKAMAVRGLLRKINLRIIADVEALAKACDGGVVADDGVF